MSNSNWTEWSTMAVIGVEPAVKYSFVSKGMQTRWKGQYNAELTLSPRLYVKLLITPITAIQGVFARVITKSDEHEARGRFENASVITRFIKSILKSLVILAIWLALSGAIYSRIAPLFALNRIFFSANENGTVKQNNQSDSKVCLK